MSEIDKIIATAKGEVGYIEKKSNSQLDDKTANAGTANYTKYARDLDSISGFYNGPKNGYDWCDVFVDWCFVQAFGVTRALELLCQPTKSCGAGVGYSANYYNIKGQFFKSNPQPGDQIFLNNMGHTGLVVAVDSNYVYTIEGNTGASTNTVAERKYALNSSSIDGYGRPKYSDNAASEETNDSVSSPNTVEYRVHIKGGDWLPWVYKVDNTDEGYAGLYGKTIDGIQVRNRTYRAYASNQWLPEVSKVDDTDEGYAGLYGKPIYGFQVQNATYRAHLKGGDWLPWVNKVDDTDEGYAGLYGREIDGIQIK